MQVTYFISSFVFIVRVKNMNIDKKVLAMNKYIKIFTITKGG